MSSRAYRKLLEARSAGAGPGGSAAQAAAPEPLDSAPVSDQASGAEEGEAAPPADERQLPKQANPFELLVVDEDDPQGRNSDEEAEVLKNEPDTSRPDQGSTKKRTKKKKKKGNRQETGEAVAAENLPGNASKKKGKRIEPENLSLADFEKALLEVTNKFGNVGTKADVQPKPERRSVNNLLSVNTRMLDANAEMRRMFGSQVVSEDSRRRKPGRVAKRTILAAQGEFWQPYAKQGLTMGMLGTENGEMHFSYEFSDDYLATQDYFYECVATHDPNTIAELLIRHPYHVDALLQMSEVLKQTGDYARAGELIERALYALERGWHSMFNVALGTCRLDYLQMENRAFFIALHRHVQLTARKGCWRTAFEFHKLLLSLDPADDPLGALLSVDYYAIKAKEYKWLLQLCDEWWAEMSLDTLPNFLFSRAVAQFLMEIDKGGSKPHTDHQLSDSYLQRALLFYPYFVELICQKCGISIPGGIENNPLFVLGQTEIGLAAEKYIKLLLDLYVERSFQVWKQPEVIAWLEKNAIVVVDRIMNEADEDVIKGKTIRKEGFGTKVPLNVCRHVVISELTSLYSALPPFVRQLPNYSFDPIPPMEGAAYAEGVDWDNPGVSSAIRALSNLFNFIAPWAQNAAAAMRPQQFADAVDAGDDDARQIGREEAIEMAREFPPGLFPPPTEQNPNPEWITSLRNTISRLFRPAAPAATAASDTAGHGPTTVLRVANVASQQELAGDRFRAVCNDLRNACARFGEVVDLRLLAPPSNPDVMNAFVQYATVDEAVAAYDAFKDMFQVSYFAESRFNAGDFE